MPKLPDASNLSGVAIGAPRSMVDMPVPDIAGAANAVARGVADVGQGVFVFAEEKRKRASQQERFDTKMNLLRAETAYADRVRDLDPLDPDYVEKKKAARRETFAPVLSSVQDPDNRMQFDLETEADYVNIGIKAGDEQKKARGTKNELDIKVYNDEMRKRILAGEDPEKVRASVVQMIQDAPDLDQLQKTALELDLLPALDMDAAEVKASGLFTGGSGTAQDKAMSILRKVEGYRAKPYWDVDADRAGYGSDTVTLADGSVVKVRKGMVVSKADAERDLKRRTAEFMSAAAADSGPAWDNLSADQQAALTSVAYNYGSLPKRVVNAIQTGDANTIANAVESLADHNGGVNRKRREAEAALIRGSASIPSSWSERPKLDTVLSQLEQDPSYLRLGVDQRDKVKASITSRYEKLEKEEQAAAKIELQRDTVDFAVSSFDDRNKAADYIKDTIADPDTREDALTMLNKEYDRIDENDKKQKEKRYNDAYEGVTAALGAGDIAAAQKIADTAEISGEERTKLKDRIAKGDARQDDPRVYDGLVALKIGNETEQRYFANLDGNGLNLSHLRHVLKAETIEALAKEQEAFRKKFEKTGKIPTYDTAGQMLDLKLQGLGVKTGDNAEPADVRFKEAMRAIMTKNTEAALDRNGGRDLTPSQMEEVLDQTFLEFRGKKPGKLWGQVDATLTAKDVYDKFAETEEDYGATSGEYLARAEKAIRAKGLPVTPELLNKWLDAAKDKGVIRKGGSQ